jgi:hypothetical protein
VISRKGWRPDNAMAASVALTVGTIAALVGCASTNQPTRLPSAEAAERQESRSAQEKAGEQAADDTPDGTKKDLVFEYGGEAHEATWRDLPGGVFEIALPHDVAGLDVDIQDEGRMQIWSRERDVLAAHAEAPDEVALRGRIVLMSKTVEDDLERSRYREDVAQSLSDEVIFVDRISMGEPRTFAGIDGSFWEQIWRFPNTDRGRSYARVHWTTARFEIERDETVWNIVLLAPETDAETFHALFLQALETLQERP